MFDIVTAMWARKKAKQYTDTAIEAIGYGFNYKGSVATESDLPTSGNTLGDVWTVVETGSEWVWTKINSVEQWLEMGIQTEDVPTQGSKKALSSGGAYTEFEKYVSYAKAQTKTEEEKLQARTNIGAGVPYTVTIDV